MIKQTANYIFNKINENLGYPETIKTWTMQNPETIKTLRVAGALLGIAFLVFSRLRPSLKIKVVAGFALCSIIKRIASQRATTFDVLKKEKELYKAILSDSSHDRWLPEEVRSSKKVFIQMLSGFSSNTLVDIKPSTYIARHVERGMSFADACQKTYAEDVQRVVSFLKKLFSDAKKSVNLRQIFHVALFFSGQMRQEIACKAKAYDSLDFGKLRYDYNGGRELISTPYLNRYSKEYVDKTKEKFQLMLAGKENLLKLEKSNFNLSVHSSRGMEIGVSFYINAGQKKIDLSLLQIYPQYSVMLEHTRADQLFDLMPHIAAQFEKILQKPSDDPDLIRELAIFQYLMAHACPFFRGSAAISEWFELALFATHGFLVDYNPEKCINLEALTSSIDDFTEAYVSGQFFNLRKS